MLQGNLGSKRGLTQIFHDYLLHLARVRVHGNTSPWPMVLDAGVA